MTEYETLMAALAGMPQGMARDWVEEVLIRGTPEGGIAGAHVIMGVEMTDPMGGKTRVVKGPYPVDVLGGDFASILGYVVIQQQATIQARDKEIADLKAGIAARDVTLDAQVETIASLRSQVSPASPTVAE